MVVPHDALNAVAGIRVTGGPQLLQALLRRVLDADDEGSADDGGVSVQLVLDDSHPVRHFDVAADVLRVLLTARSLDGDQLLRAARTGVVAIVTEDSPLADLTAAVAVARQGVHGFSVAEVAAMLGALRREHAVPVKDVALSAREVDLLRSMESGQSVKQTARSLGIAVKTVENTQRLLFRKLDVRNRAQAIARTHELGLLVDPPNPPEAVP